MGSSPRSYLFTSAKGRSGVHTAPKNGKKNYPICDAPLSRSARRSFARRHRNCASTTVLVCEQKPCPVWFSWRLKSYPVLCEHGLKFLNNQLYNSINVFCSPCAELFFIHLLIVSMEPVTEPVMSLVRILRLVHYIQLSFLANLTVFWDVRTFIWISFSRWWYKFK